MSYALLSVSDKTGLPDLAQALVACGCGLVSSGGTAKHLREAGFQVQSVDELTGFPECLDGRVKTLHPKIHGGILHRRDDSEHRKSVSELELPTIDFVVCNLYPFESKVFGAELGVDDAVEFIDIGGPSMIRSAAKNWKWVSVVTDPSDYSAVIEQLEATAAVPHEMRRNLAGKAFAHTARYDALIFRYFQGLEQDVENFPQHLILPLDRVNALRYGENPHQGAAVYALPGCAPGIPGAEQLHGKALSYNNLLDLDGAWSLASFLPSDAAVIVKHTNPCGAARVSGDLLKSFQRALACDPISAFGGIVALNGIVRKELAAVISERFVEIVAASDFAPEALEILQTKKNLRIMKMNPESAEHDRYPWTFRSIGGGALVQDPDLNPEVEADWTVVSQRAPTDEEWLGIRLNWSVCRFVKSNAIVCGDHLGTSAIGAGQMSRVDAVEICRLKAKLELSGCVAASDAFFPFRDGIDGLAEAGIRAIIQPGGSIRDQEVIEAVNEHNMTMVFTGKRHFRH